MQQAAPTQHHAPAEGSAPRPSGSAAGSAPPEHTAPLPPQTLSPRPVQAHGPQPSRPQTPGDGGHGDDSPTQERRIDTILPG